MTAAKDDDKTNQRLKRLVQRFAQAKLSATFAAWKVCSRRSRDPLADLRPGELCPVS
jgi:hypothetical protein